MEGNHSFWIFFNNDILPFFIGPDGSFNTVAISSAFADYEIPSEQRPIIRRKCIMVSHGINRVRETERKKRAKS